VQLCLSFSRVDEILDEFAGEIGVDFEGYRNHVYRGLNYFGALHDAAAPVPEPVLLAAAFHDIGIWTDATFDYLAPSERRAHAWLKRRGLMAYAPEVAALIHEHHKLRTYRGEFARSVEAYRKADQVDVSLGVLRFGLPATFIHEVRAAFPSQGFHRLLAKLTLRQCLRTPLRPLPMFHL
jgi:hypothetical protein